MARKNYELSRRKFLALNRGLVVGIPVQVHGITVRTGDIIHGDINGLVQVPNERIDELASKVEEVRKKEEKLMSKVNSGRFTLDDLRNYLIGNDKHH